MLHLSKWLSFAGLLGVVACATAPTYYPEHPLVDQILKVRAGHKGMLTNRTVGPGATPKDPPVEKITEYPIADPEFRKTANKLDFICNIGGHRYKLCLDEPGKYRPGFCRISHDQRCFLGVFCSMGEQRIEFLSADDFDFLLKSNARCANKNKYNLWEGS
jgi:hypothetical protein